MVVQNSVVISIGTSKGAEIEGSMSDETRFRLNIGGKTQLTDSVSAFGFYEAEQGTEANEFKPLHVRWCWDFDGQAVSFGRQDMASVIVLTLRISLNSLGVQQVFDAASDKEDGVIAYRGGLMLFS
ncbi:hypothetical protein O9992_20425 [Vibrio lentus]|nr:hypothetical protein [Vibrio lentus]